MIRLDEGFYRNDYPDEGEDPDYESEGSGESSYHAS